MTRQQRIFVSLAVIAVVAVWMLRKYSAFVDQPPASANQQEPIDNHIPSAASVERSAHSEGWSASDLASKDTGSAAGESELVELADVLSVAEDMLRRLKTEVKDYQAKMIKRERIDGELGPAVSMQLKVRNADASGKGFAAYLRFVEPESVAGREVIWGPDFNGGQLQVHEVGIKRLLGTLSLDPNGLLAMRGQKYPISEIGLVRLVEKLIEKGNREARIGQAVVRVNEECQVGDRACTLYEVVNPKDNGESDFHIARVYVDTERMLPLKYAAYLWPSEIGGQPQLEEEYSYLELETNIGLTSEDFDPNNPQYDFP